VNRETLLALSKENLVAMILAQHAQIAALTARIMELEARLGGPPKTPDNSSLPPSKGQKPNLPDRPKKPHSGRPGVARRLAEHPGQNRRGDAGGLSALRPHARPCRPARHPRLRPYRPATADPICHAHQPPSRHLSLLPKARRRGGAGRVRTRLAIRAWLMCAGHPSSRHPGDLHVTQAIGFERLARLMAEVFGVTISEGAIANILTRAEAPLLAAAAPIAAAVRASAVVGSDETSARVGGKTWWQWVLLSSTAICHPIANTRVASVVTAFMDGTRPEVWVADRYAGQAGHGAVRQMCLAHLPRDAPLVSRTPPASGGSRQLSWRTVWRPQPPTATPSHLQSLPPRV